jgi:glycosyltransferase 2 family protein
MAVLTSLPVRLVVTAALLVLLAVEIEWAPVVDRLEAGRWGWMVAAVALMSGALALGAGRWRVLLRVSELPCEWGATLRAFYLGSFANSFLPTGFGGDVVRALAVGRRHSTLARATSTVVLDRLGALYCLLLLAWLVLPLDPGRVPRALVAGLGVVSLIALGGAVVLGLSATARVVRRLVPERLRPAARELAVPLGALVRSPRAIVKVVVLGVGFQALAVGSVWMAARAVDIRLSYVLLATTVPLVLIVTMIPVSLAGFGLREGSYAVLLGEAGVSAGDATLVSLLTVVVLAVASLPGALALIGFRRERAERAAHSPP